MALRQADDCSRYGRVLTNGDGMVTDFGEKGHAGPGLINAGIYLQRRAPLRGFGEAPFSLETDYLAKLSPEWPIQGLRCEGYFIDIGIPQDLERARQDMAAGRS
jgi:NDP-sugar pyrophosphorylase family protein